jgi:hypothetical protein
MFSGVFADIDKFAFETPEEKTKTVPILTDYLMNGVASQNNSNNNNNNNNNNNTSLNTLNNQNISLLASEVSIIPFLKIRAIFSWIARNISYDVELFESGTLSSLLVILLYISTLYRKK